MRRFPKTITSFTFKPIKKFSVKTSFFNNHKLKINIILTGISTFKNKLRVDKEENISDENINNFTKNLIDNDLMALYELY